MQYISHSSHRFLPTLLSIWVVMVCIGFQSDLAALVQDTALLRMIMDILMSYGVFLVLYAYLYILLTKHVLTGITKFMVLFAAGGAILTGILLLRGSTYILGPLYTPSWSILAISSSVLLFQEYKPRLNWLGYTSLGIIGIAEYLSHTSSLLDIGVSFGIGTAFATCVLLVQQWYGAFTRMAHKFAKEVEYRRQLAHLVTGSILSLGMYTTLFPPALLFATAVIGGGVILFLKRGHLQWIKKYLSIFERVHHMERFPGRGVFYFVIGAFASSLLFPKDIAAASILILGIGDSFTNIVGKDFGKHPIFYNIKKNIEGPICGAILATIGASLFVPFPWALGASIVAMFVETLPLRIRGFDIDDNLSIPLTAGLILTVAHALGAFAL